ncbi:MAG TPA: exonuclease domain-containing protein [Candidatus Binataceae bacterium]|nr:exonuclease domain-containing protein [Candidatus Binataceae bacterium]
MGDSSMNLPSNFSSPPRVTIREKLHLFLRERPGGADGNELARLLFRGVGRDPELGARLIRGVLGADPKFYHDEAAGLWSLRQAASMRVVLDEAQFVVVDLETTGGRVAPGAIIEIGAYRMRGRRMVESFQSLIRPRFVVSSFITRLTSITNEMLAQAPPVEAVLPEFRAFLGDAVMVAHNAPFDHSFLDFEFRQLFGMGLLNPVLCTVRMARRLLPLVKRRRLDLLAEHFGLSTAGRHRALGDARMTAELFSIFLEIVERMGIDRLDRLIDDHGRGAAGRRIERHVPPEVIAAMPRAPGVYLMRNERGELLYIGKARRLRDRVAAYFNGGANAKAKTAELISHVWAIETRVMRSALEAGLSEARLIREHKPPYNRMLKAAAPAHVIRLDLNDPFPRLRIAQKLRAKTGVLELGPFIGRRKVDHSIRALSRILGMRICSGRLAPDENFSPCIYGQMGHCAMPCNKTVGEDDYNARVGRAVAFLRGRVGPLLGDLVRARDQAGAAMRFEEARRCHRELEALAALTERAGRLSRVVTENNLVIVVGGVAVGESGAPCAPDSPTACAYVVLSGRLALTRELVSRDDAAAVAAFVAENFERYRMRPVSRDELEPMMIVARWLKERAPDDGRLIYLDGPVINPATIFTDRDCSAQLSDGGSRVATASGEAPRLGR